MALPGGIVTDLPDMEAQEGSPTETETAGTYEVGEVAEGTEGRT